MNSEQCRTARTMMGWTVKRLSQIIRVNEKTIRDFEKEDRAKPETKARIRSIFVTNGIEFIEDDHGIGLKRRFKLDEYVSRNEKHPSRARLGVMEMLELDATG